MDDTELQNTTMKYITLVRIINVIENRLGWSELVFLTLNLVVFMFSLNFVSSSFMVDEFSMTPLSLTFVLFSLVLGMSLCAYWAVTALKLQLKLKMHYFQARSLERKMNCAGECIFSDASIFFDPQIRRLESADEKETLYYPTSGLTRMDGFIGAAKPRLFSWLMPCLFLVLYWVIFLWVAIRFVNA